MAVAPVSGAGSRRVVYGLNTLLQAALALGVLIFVVWLAQRYSKSIDLTSSGVNSLSSGTRNLLEKLPEKVSITALYSVTRKTDQLGEKRMAMVRDLLSLYDSAGGAKVDTFLIDPQQERARVTRLLQELREKPMYKDEWQPHKAAIEKAAPLATNVLQMMEQELRKFDELQAGNEGLRSQNAGQVRALLQNVQRQADGIAKQLPDFLEAEVPLYGEAAKSINKFAESTAEMLEAVQSWAASAQRSIATPSVELQQWLGDIPANYTPLIGEAKSLAAETASLQPVKLEQIYRELSAPNPILVQTSQELYVVPFSEVWPIKTEDLENPPPDDDVRNFAGEAAISSAILRLTQKEKTAVIFTRYGGASPFTFDEMAVQMARMQGQLPPPPPFAQLNQDLKRANFETADWDVKASKTPPTVEGAVRTIYVVFPPEPPDQRNRMRPPTEGGMPPEDAKIVTDAVEASGLGVFLSGWQPPAVGMPGMSALADYPYSLYLEQTWGILPRVNHFVIAFTPNMEKKGGWVPKSQNPLLLLSPEDIKVREHEITRPMMSLPVGLRLTCPVELASGERAPSGVTWHTLVEVPATEDTWAVQDVDSLRRELTQEVGGTTPKETSIRAPFPEYVVATRKDGDKEKKVVVVGSSEWLVDRVAHAAQLMVLGGALVQAEVNPGNTDLLLNTLHWMTGNADRIAVGPRAGGVPRLTELNDGPELVWSRVFLVGIWPGLALLAGLVMSFFRRR